MLDPHFVILGAVINILGEISYIVHTIQGKTRPNRVTWFLFAFAPLIAFMAELSEGVGIQSLQTFIVGFGPLMIFLASFVNRKSVWQITPFDIICGCISVAALILWLLTNEGVIAVALSIAADGFAAIPTIVKAWKVPESESSLIFLLAAINAAITLLTFDHITFIGVGFATYILLTCILLYVLVHFRAGPRLLEWRHSLREGAVT